MGKTRNLFKKIRDTKGTFHAKMALIKDRNGMDLTEAEDTLDISNPDKAVTTIHIPQDAHPTTFHLICEVHDNGPFHLVAYKAINLIIK